MVNAITYLIIRKRAMEEKKEQHNSDRQSAASKAIQDKPAEHSNDYVSGGQKGATRPEQGPEVPPEERTLGIP
ncbi:hypothetical protein [Pontibacter rugosus]